MKRQEISKIFELTKKSFTRGEKKVISYLKERDIWGENIQLPIFDLADRYLRYFNDINT